MKKTKNTMQKTLPSFLPEDFAALSCMTIPNIISGFFGMNVPVPLAHFGWAFYAIVGAVAVICLIVFLILLKKKMF